MNYILILLLAVAIGTIVFLSVGKGRNSSIIQREISEFRKINDIFIDESRKNTEAQIQQMQRAADIRLETVKSEYREQIRELNRRLEEQAVILKRQSAVEFRSLAEDILAAKQNSLREDNQRSLEAVITPLKENITEFRKAVSDFYIKDADSRQSLKAQIEALMLSNRDIGREARNLTQALQSNSKVQGEWGETVLESLLSRIGMIRDVNYIVQSSTDIANLSDNNDKRIRPDVIVLLPDDNKLIIDSKVSMKSYLEFYNSEDSKAEKTALRHHCESVKKHIDELASKQYHKYIPGALEHTLMFIPNDPAFIAAVTHDPSLWDYAYSRNIVMISSTHLYSVLQIVTQLWRIEKQNRNAEEIGRLGGLIFDKASMFIDEFRNFETAISDLGKSYAKCSQHIEHPSVGLKARALRLKDLGVKASRKITE